MKRYKSLFIIFLTLTNSSFAFLKLFTARSIALQNTTVASYSAESVSINPSMITLDKYKNYKDEIYLCNTKILSDINSFYLSFVKSIYKIGIDLFYQDYGEIESINKTFSSNLLRFSISKKFNSSLFEIGINLSYQKQRMDIYSSEVGSLSVGFVKNLDKFIMALVIRNVLSTEYKFIETKEKFPLIIEIGTSYEGRILSSFFQITYDRKIKNLPISLEYKVNPHFSLTMSYDTINYFLNVGCSVIFNYMFIDVGYSFFSSAKPFSISIGYFF